MSARRTTLVAAAAVSAMLIAPTAAFGTGSSSSPASLNRLAAVGLTDHGTALVEFQTNRPRQAKPIGHVNGLSGDTRLVGIDYRVQDGLLYGVGDRGGIYTVSDDNGHAVKVQQLTQALEGTSFGVDFNPAANALRIIGDTGQNLRQPFAGPTAGVTQVDGRLNTPVEARGISAAAYTNNDLAASTATSLFDIDTTLDQVVLQSPANSGTVVATGALGVDAGPDAGFDIYSRPGAGGTETNAGIAVLSVGGVSSVYRVELLTGATRSLGDFRVSVTDIAIQLDQG